MKDPGEYVDSFSATKGGYVQRDFLSHDVSGNGSKVATMEADCANKKLRVVRQVFYSERMGKGRTELVEGSPGPWHPYTESGIAYIIGIVCFP